MKLVFKISNLIKMKTTFLVIFLSIAALTFSQTTDEKIDALEKRVKKIEDTLGFSGPVTSLVVPVKNMLPVMTYAHTNLIIQPYNPVGYENGVFTMYYRWGTVPVVSKSLKGQGGVSNWYYNGYPVTMPKEPGSIVKGQGGKWYSLNHEWQGGNCYRYSMESSDGINFTRTSMPRFRTGEDCSIIYENGIYHCFIRPNKPSLDSGRTIGYMSSTDFYNWSSIKTILKPLASDGTKQFYNMTVVKVPGHGYFGIMNVLELDPGRQDVNQQPPYALNDNTVGVQLVWSADLVNGGDWKRCNSGKDFIPRPDIIKQIFGLPTLVGSELWIYTFETENRHVTWKDQNNPKYWSIYNYKISINDLVKYIPAS